MSDIAQSGAVAAVDWQKDGKGNQNRKSKGDANAKRAMASYAASDRVISDEITILGMSAADMSADMQAAVGDLLAEVQSLRAQLGLPTAPASALQGSQVLGGPELVEAAERVVANGVADHRHLGAVLIDVGNFEDLRISHGLMEATGAMKSLAQRVVHSAPLRLEPIGLLTGGLIAGLTSREADDTDWSGPEAALDVWLSDQSFGPDSYDGPLKTRSHILELERGETFSQVIDRADQALSR